MLAEIATYDYTYTYSYCFNLRLAIILQQLMTTHTYLHEAAPTNYDLVHEAYIVQMQITCMSYKQEFVTIRVCNSIWFLLPTNGYHLSSVT